MRFLASEHVPLVYKELQLWGHLGRFCLVGKVDGWSWKLEALRTGVATELSKKAMLAA